MLKLREERAQEAIGLPQKFYWHAKDGHIQNQKPI